MNLLGLLIQVVCFASGLYALISGLDWPVYVAGALLVVTILLGVITGTLTSGLTTVVIVGIIGSVAANFLVIPWWHGAIIANAMVDGIEVLFSIGSILFLSNNRQNDANR